jgi:hypothetical protein
MEGILISSIRASIISFRNLSTSGKTIDDSMLSPCFCC